MLAVSEYNVLQITFDFEECLVGETHVKIHLSTEIQTRVREIHLYDCEKTESVVVRYIEASILKSIMILDITRARAVHGSDTQGLRSVYLFEPAYVCRIPFDVGALEGDILPRTCHH